MKSWRAISALVACIVCLAFTIPSAAAPPILRCDPRPDGRPITPFAEVLEDPSGKLTFEAARATGTGWSAGPPGAFVFGFTTSRFWVRWLIENPSTVRSELIVDLGNPRQDYVDWYVLRNGSTVELTRSGDRLPYRERPLDVRDFALPLTLQAGEKVELYVRLASYDGLFEAMPVRLYARDDFFSAIDGETALLSLYHGGLLALAVYNLLLFVATRQRSFALYVGYMFSLLLWNLTFRGYCFQYLWPNATAFNNNILTVAAAWAFGIFGLFTIEYLQLRASVPRWVLRLNQAVAWLNIAVVLPAAADHYALGAGIGQVTGIAMAVLSLATGTWLLICGMRQARYFMLAFTLLGMGATGYILQVIGAAPANLLTTWGLQVGSAIEALVLALGLADALNAMKAKMLLAERRLRESEQSRNVELERRVAERTQELERNRDNLQSLVEARTADLLAAKDTAEAANRAKSAFLTNMSHELRTPMHAIISFARLGLAKTQKPLLDPEKLRTYYERIGSSADRLLRMLNDLLDLSKLESGKMDFERIPFDLGAAIESSVGEYELLGREKKVAIHVERGPAVRVCGDRQRVIQVIGNLLSNAIKFSPERRWVHIQWCSDRLPGPDASDPHTGAPAVCLTVSDEGIGIPPEELACIFDQFVQSSRTKTGAGGTGLGLAICREIVDAHGGRIWAENRPGGGTTVHVVLPIDVSDPTIEPSGDRAPNEAASLAERDGSGTRV